MFITKSRVETCIMFGTFNHLARFEPRAAFSELSPLAWWARTICVVLLVIRS